MLGLARSNLYYRAKEDTVLERALIQRLDEEYTAHPFYGSRRMTAMLRRVGYPVNCKRVIRLMVRLGWQAIYPKPVTSRSGAAPPVYPYSLRGVAV